MAEFQSPELRQKYIDYLTSEGHFTPEEAKAEADKATSGGRQNKKASSGAIMPPEPADVQKTLSKSVEERAKQEGLTFGEKVGLGAGGAALLAGGGYLLGGGKPSTPSGGQGLKGRVFGPDVSATRIEPQMDVSRPTEPYFEGEKAPKSATAGTWEDLLSPEEKALIERSRANAPVREEYMKQIAPPVPTEPPAFIRNQPPASTAPVPELPAATNPRVPALLQPPAGAAVPSVALAPVPPTADKPAPPPPAPAPITPAATVPVAETIEAPKVKPPKAPKIQTEEQRIAGAKNWFVSHFGGQADPQAHAAYDRLVNEVLKGKPPMMGPGGGVPPEFNEFKKWYETNLQGPAKPSREALKAAISSVPRGAAAPPSLRPNEIGQGGGSLIRSLTDPLQLKQ